MIGSRARPMCTLIGTTANPCTGTQRRHANVLICANLATMRVTCFARRSHFSVRTGTAAVSCQQQMHLLEHAQTVDYVLITTGVLFAEQGPSGKKECLHNFYHQRSPDTDAHGRREYNAPYSQRSAMRYHRCSDCRICLTVARAVNGTVFEG